MHIFITWDPAKAQSNLARHGVSFDETASARLDPMARAFEDPDASDEQRWVALGSSTRLRLLVVMYSTPNDSVIRLISARKANRKEVSTHARRL
jgi:uncharacterized DUF497 family protein